MICCQDLPGRRDVASPFREVLAFDWYDGPTEGITRCGVCSRVYAFRMCAWEPPGRFRRVFRLESLPGEVFQEAVEIASSTGAPRWPVWVPIWPEMDGPDPLAAYDEEVARRAVDVPAKGLLLLTRELEERIEAALSIAGHAQDSALPEERGEDADFGLWHALFMKAPGESDG